MAQVPPRRVRVSDAGEMDTEEYAQDLRDRGFDEADDLYALLVPTHKALQEARSVVKEAMDELRVWADEPRGLTGEEVADLVKRVSEASSRASATEAKRLVRQMVLRAAVMLGLGFVAMLLIGGGVGWWVGNQTVRSTEQRVIAAFQNGRAGAETWARLMQNNDPVAALERCTGAAVRAVEGRRACSVPLWLDPPRTPQ